MARSAHSDQILCPACDGYPGVPPSRKGERLKCEFCGTWLSWNHRDHRLEEAPEREVLSRTPVRLTKRDLDHLPPLVMTSGGRLVQRCIGCWDEVEFLTSSEIKIGRLSFVPMKPPSDPPPPDWERKWIPVVRMQKGPGCAECSKAYVAYCGQRGMQETVSKLGERKRHSQPYIPVGKEHLEEVQQWFAQGSAYAEPLGWRLLVGVTDVIPSSLGMKVMRSCDKRFGLAQRVEVIKPFGTVMLWDGPFALHNIVPLKVMIDRTLAPSQKGGLLVVVEKVDQKMLQHLQDLREGKTLVNCWGMTEDPNVEFVEA